MMLAEMPESPLSPTTARQNPASSLLSHTDSSGGERVANGNAGTLSGDDWQTLQHKQVRVCPATPSSCTSSSFSSSFSSFLSFISGKQNTLPQTDVKREIPHGLILDILWQDTKPRAHGSVDSDKDFI